MEKTFSGMCGLKNLVSSRNVAVALLVLTGLRALLLSGMAPWVGDDIEYRFMAEDGSSDLSGPAVTGLRDVAVSQWYHYFNITGRTVAHTLVQIINPLMGQTFFAVANGLMYVLFVLTLLRQVDLEGGGWRKRPGLTALACGLTLLTFNTSFTPTCQVGYVWMFTLVFWWLSCYFRADSLSYGRLWLLALAGLVAGWGQEALNIGVCGALLLHVMRRRSLPSGFRWLAAAFCLGTLLICLSPGALARAGRTSVGLPESAAVFLRFSRAFLLLVVYVVWLTLCRRVAWRELYLRNRFYVEALLILVGFNFLIGISAPARQLFGIEALSIVLLLRLWNCRGGGFCERTVTLALVLAAAGMVAVSQFRLTARTRICYDNIIRESRTAEDGSVVYSCFEPDNRLWPGEHFARTIERLIENETGKTLTVLPAPEEETGCQR